MHEHSLYNFDQDVCMKIYLKVLLISMKIKDKDIKIYLNTYNILLDMMLYILC